MRSKKRKLRVGPSRADLFNESSNSDVQQWRIRHIEAAIKQADEGQLIEHQQVKTMAERWRHTRKGR
jgi:predicted transcriptional regulator